MVIIFILLILMNSITEYQLNKMMLTMHILEQKNVYYHAVTSLLRIVWIACCAWFAFSLPLFLFGLFLLLSLNVLPYRSRSLLLQNFTMIIYLLYSSLLMLVVGCAGLLGMEYASIVQQDMLRFLILNITFLLHNLICFFMLRFRPDFFWNEELDRLKVLIYTRFLFICTLYHFIDAIVLTYYSIIPIDDMLLISGDILVLVLMFMFLNYNHVFIKSEALQKQYEESEVLLAQQYFEKESLKELSEHDPLTSAYNRREIGILMQDALQQGKQLVCVFIDIDGLKRMNDKYGHSFGDVMLKRFANVCNQVLQDKGTLARIGGDEFLLIFQDQSMEVVEACIKQLQLDLLQADEEKDNIYFSYGIASQEDSVDAYITSADQKMYKCKQGKRRDTLCK